MHTPFYILFPFILIMDIVSQKSIEQRAKPLVEGVIASVNHLLIFV